MSKLVSCIGIRIDTLIFKKLQRFGSFVLSIFVFLFSIYWLAAFFSCLRDFNFALQLENDLDSFDLFEQIGIQFQYDITDVRI